jgi:UDP-2,4-diacetamido-2,4,6-trideoxy-beta-L-altropyranose hydrolase
VKVLIRADASTLIGSGHVMRCLALAAQLKALGADLTFACRALPDTLQRLIAAQGHCLLMLPEAEATDGASADDTMIQRAGLAQAHAVRAEGFCAQDIAELGAILLHRPRFDWIIVDHYQLDARWEMAARRWGWQLAAIDDLADRAHAVDLLLDQNLDASTARYAPRLQRSCRTLFGPRYALLREEFRRAANPLRAEATRVVVNFGGMDAVGATLKAMHALEDLPGLQVDFVAGEGNPYWPQLQALSSGKANWQLHAHSPAFGQLMAAADVFVGAGGGTSWERAALGLPTICLAVADNQVANACALAEAGVHCYLGLCAEVTVAALRQVIVELLADVERRRQFAERGRRLVDGQGARRVAVALATACVQMRQVTIDDALQLYEGRNAPEVRRWSLQSRPIAWEEHLLWLGATLADPQRLLLLASAADGPIAVLRYDRQGARAEVSIYLLAGRFGLGWGRVVLASGEAFVHRRWPAVEYLDAQVVAGNRASISLFQDAGYVQCGWRFERQLKDHDS